MYVKITLRTLDLSTSMVKFYFLKLWRCILAEGEESVPTREQSLNFSNFLYILFLGMNFKNLIVKFHVLYVLNMHIKFRLNWMLFIIRSINLFFIHNFRSHKLETFTFVW